jgi:hypothetical protein
MKVHGISQLKKKDTPLYYRNEYEGIGDLEFTSGIRREVPLQFTVEMLPTGERMVDVRLTDRIDYPLIPVIRALKDTISRLEQNGELR